MPAVPNRRKRGIVIATGVLVACLIAAIAWSELHPKALAEAEASYRRGNFELALSKARSHLNRRSFSRAALLTAARSLSSLDRSEQAEPYYNKAGALNLEDQHTRALGIVKGNLRAQAIEAYQQILTRWPDDVLALRRLAAVQISESRWAEALQTAKRLIAIPAGAVIGHTLAGVVHHNTTNIDQSVVEFGRALDLDPELKLMPLTPRSMFWEEYGQDLLATGQAVLAEKCLHRALAESGNATIADLLGQSYYQQGEIEEAERCWRYTLDLDPNRADTWWRIGRLQLQQDKLEDAVASLLRAAQLAPKAIEPAFSLSLAYRRMGRREEADRLQAEVSRLRDKTAALRGGMGSMPSLAP